MYWVRSVELGDLDGLVALASEASYGLTTLRPDPERLRRRIDASVEGEAPLLVMVHGDHTNVVGTAGLTTCVGDASRAEPFYAYRLERTLHVSEALGVRHEVKALHLVKAFDGPTEIGTLFLHPDHRGGGNGRVLSLSRFLWMAQTPDRFDRQVIAELRGVVDEDGRSPFWDALGRHFFQVEYPVADDMSSRDKRFIAELMPTHPIYLPLLPKEARRVIGRVHPRTEPARRLLEDEGFHDSGMVDIFDAGPCLRCDLAAIRTVRESRVVPVDELWDHPPQGTIHALVAPTRGAFRLVGADVTLGPGGLRISRDHAATLGVQPGDTVRLAPSRASQQQTEDRYFETEHAR